MIHTVYDQILLLYKEILSYYMKPEIVKKAESISPSNPDYFLKPEEVYLGTNVLLALEDVPRAMQIHIRSRCINFLVKACCEIKRKFNFLNSTECLLKHLSVFDPKNVLQCRTLTPILKYFPSLEANLKQNIDSEFRNLINCKDSLDFSLDVEEFWLHVGKLQCGNDLLFPNLCNFIFNYIFILPFSSANVERVFSTINNNKIKLRNRLNTDSLKGILHVKELFHNDEKCFSFNVADNMYKKFNSNMYQFSNKMEEKVSDTDTDSDL